MSDPREKKLSEVLKQIEPNDTNYDVRYKLVTKALALAVELDYQAGIRWDEAEQWPVFCIYLPHIGEVSWHCPPYTRPFTGYDTKEKYRRVHDYVSKFE